MFYCKVSLPQRKFFIKIVNFRFYSDLLAPVQTIFPELKMRAVVLGSRILMMTAAKRYENGGRGKINPDSSAYLHT